MADPVFNSISGELSMEMEQRIEKIEQRIFTLEQIVKGLAENLSEQK